MIGRSAIAGVCVVAALLACAIAAQSAGAIVGTTAIYMQESGTESGDSWVLQGSLQTRR